MLISTCKRSIRAGEVLRHTHLCRELKGEICGDKWEPLNLVGWESNTGDFHDHIPGRTPQVGWSSLQCSRKTKWSRAKMWAVSQKISTWALNLAVMLRWYDPKTASWDWQWRKGKRNQGFICYWRSTEPCLESRRTRTITLEKITGFRKGCSWNMPRNNTG